MGYTKSRGAIVRNLPQLEQLISDKATLLFPTPNPKRLAYKIYEALSAVDEVEDTDEYARFRPIRKMYTFKVKADGLLAVYEPPMEEIRGEPVGQGVAAEPQKKKIQVPSATHPDAMYLMDVLLYASKAREQELLFPNVMLPYDDKVTLYGWALEHGWNYIDHETEGLTLTKQDVPEVVLWTPEDEG